MAVIIHRGSLKGRRLAVPKTKAGVRPTAAMVREAVFSMIALSRDMVFIDMFAGSGIMGFTALSIGCGSVIFIDIDNQVVRGLRKNTSLLDVSGSVRIWKGNVLAYFRRLQDIGMPCALYVDPPYAYSQWHPLLGKLASWAHSAMCRAIVLESNKQLQPLWPGEPGPLLSRSRRYGEKQLLMLTKEEGVV